MENRRADDRSAPWLSRVYESLAERKVSICCNVQLAGLGMHCVRGSGVCALALHAGEGLGLPEFEGTKCRWPCGMMWEMAFARYGRLVVFGNGWRDAWFLGWTWKCRFMHEDML